VRVAEPLVVVAGMMCDARLWAPQIARFSAGRAVHVAPITGADRVDALAASLLADAPPRFALAGLSMGGIVAMAVMAQAPERVTRIALLDTNPKAERAEVAAARGPQMDKVRAGLLRSVMRDEMKPNYLAPGPGQGAVLDLVLDMAMSLGPEVFLRQSRALMTRPDQQDVLRQVCVPALILCGEHDTLCPLHRHELMADLIPDARLEVVKDAGHMPTLEQPDAVNAAFERWLNA